MERLLDIEEGRLAAIREQFARFRRQLMHDVVTIGMLLDEVSTRRLYEAWGYRSIKQCIERELGISPRSGLYLIAIYRIFVRGFGCSVEELADIGWAKLARISHVVTADTVAGWLAYCRTHSLREVDVAVHAAMDDKKKDELSIKQTWSVLLTPMQAAVVNRALQAAKYEGGTDDNGQALEYIAADFLSGVTPSGVPRHALLPDTPAEEAVER